jgi:hypothetical protein
VIDVHESVGCYALSALDRSDLIEFEAHLATCAACQTEAAEFCETAAELTMLSLATPRLALRASILAAVGATPQLPALDGTVRSTLRVSTTGSRPAAESRRAASGGPGRAAPELEMPEPPAPVPRCRPHLSRPGPLPARDGDGDGSGPPPRVVP